MINMLIGGFLIVVGYLLCYLTISRRNVNNTTEVEVKRVKPSFRNPLRTYEVQYDKYKSREGLYEPQKAKRSD